MASSKNIFSDAEQKIINTASILMSDNDSSKNKELGETACMLEELIFKKICKEECKAEVVKPLRDALALLCKINLQLEKMSSSDKIKLNTWDEILAEHGKEEAISFLEKEIAQASKNGSNRSTEELEIALEWLKTGRSRLLVKSTLRV